MNSHVDTNTVNHVSLCSGYGGIDLGIKRVLGTSVRTVAYVEIEAFAVSNLVSKASQGWLDNAPVFSDLKRFPWGKFRGLVDILSGGYPCQPFSSAGKRAGDEDPRHLFPYILDGIGRCRPSVVFLENVEGILSARLAGDGWRDPAGTPVLLHVLRELERVGYKATAGVFSASEVGAPHQRKRVFIMAHRKGFRIQGHGADWIKESLPYVGEGLPVRGSVAGVWPSRPGEPQHPWEPPRVVENSQGMRGGEPSNGNRPSASWSNASSDEDLGNAAAPRRSQHCAGFNESQDDSCTTHRDEVNRQTQPSLGGDPNGPSYRVGHAELQEPDHADCGASGECGSAMAHSFSGWGQQSRSQRRPGEVEENASDIQGQGNQQTVIPNHESNDGRGVKADLYTSCDNRTDELRLLGNGVVPATAELAFRTLWRELVNE